LLEVTLRWASKCFESAEPVVLSTTPVRTTHEHGVAALSRWNLWKIWRALGRARALVFGGGGLFQDVTSRRSVLYYAGLAELARWRRVPVFLLGQGLGPLRSGLARRLTRHAFRRAVLRDVRDEESLQLLKEWGLEALCGYDLALALPPPAKEREGVERPLLGVALREAGWRGHEREEFIAEVAAGLDAIQRELGLGILFLPFHPRADLRLILEVREAMATPSALVELSEARVEDLLRIVGQLGLLLGMRLHALEFALLQGVPFLALRYDPKIEHLVMLVRELGALELPVLSPTEVTRERLFHGIERLWEERVALREGLRGCGGRLRALTEEHLEGLCQRAHELISAGSG